MRERKHLYIDTLNLVYGLRADINYFLLGNLLFRLDFHRCLEPGLPSPRGEFGVTGGGEVGGSTGSFPKQRLIIKPLGLIEDCARKFHQEANAGKLSKR